jgi:hypothetical protein
MKDLCIDWYLHLMKDVSSSHEWVVWFWEDREKWFGWVDLTWVVSEWWMKMMGKTISIIFIYGVRRLISFVRLKKTTLLNRVSFFFKPTTYYNCCLHLYFYTIGSRLCCVMWTKKLLTVILKFGCLILIRRSRSNYIALIPNPKL